MRDKKKILVFTASLIVLAFCSACDPRITYHSQEPSVDGQSTYEGQPYTYEIMGAVDGTANLYVGTLNPGTERPQTAFFRYVGYNKYKLVEAVNSGVPHYAVYQDTLYYFGDYSAKIYAISGVRNGDLGQPVTMTPDFGDDRYEFQSILTIQDDWIYIEAEKWGTNEAGYEVFLPGYYLAIHINGRDWKEVAEADIPKNK